MVTAMAWVPSLTPGTSTWCGRGQKISLTSAYNDERGLKIPSLPKKAQNTTKTISPLVKIKNAEV